MAEERKAPAIVGKAKEEPKAYYFKVRGSPGASIPCFMGNCPKKGENYRNTITNTTLQDGQVVYLKETEYNHLSKCGTERPVLQDGPGGRKVSTGQTYTDTRFELHPV